RMMSPSRPSLPVSYSRPVSSLFCFPRSAPASFSLLSLHDALPISHEGAPGRLRRQVWRGERARPVRLYAGLAITGRRFRGMGRGDRKHTSELQSPDHLVCRLLLEKKKKRTHADTTKRKTRRPMET